MKVQLKNISLLVVVVICTPYIVNAFVSQSDYIRDDIIEISNQ